MCGANVRSSIWPSSQTPPYMNTLNLQQHIGLELKHDYSNMSPSCYVSVGLPFASSGAVMVLAASSCESDRAMVFSRSTVSAGTLWLVQSPALPHSTMYNPATTAIAPNKLHKPKVY